MKRMRELLLLGRLALFIIGLGGLVFSGGAKTNTTPESKVKTPIDDGGVFALEARWRGGF